MKINTVPSFRHTLPALATAAVLALTPGRAAADPPAIYVSDAGAGTVPAYDATGTPATGYTTPSGFSDAEGGAYNPASNTLYVADAETSKIRTFNATTGAETTTATGFGNGGALSTPEGLALGAGNLYVANTGRSTLLAFSLATGTAAPGFTSPKGVNGLFGLAASATTLYVTSLRGTVGAFSLATGVAMPGFTTISGAGQANGVAVYGNDLFVSNGTNGTVSEYNALTGAVVNASFVTGLSNPQGLAVLGDRLLVSDNGHFEVNAYGIPTVATAGNTPTDVTTNFLPGINSVTFVTTATVAPEPGTWALLGVGAAGLGVVTLRRQVRHA